MEYSCTVYRCRNLLFSLGYLSSLLVDSSIIFVTCKMKFPTHIFQQRFAKYQCDFINLPEKERDFINSPFVNSKFLRIGSNVGYSQGRFFHIQEIDWETTELLEIEDIDLYMKELYLEWKHVFDLIRNNPEMMKEFSLKFAN